MEGFCTWDTWFDKLYLRKGKSKTMCVNRMLVIPPLYIIGIAWAGNVKVEKVGILLSCRIIQLAI